MGMDVYGQNAKSGTGEYFRANVWYWHPLWDYCQLVSASTAGAVKYGHTNDGDGLDEKMSIALASKLRTEIESGRCAQYAKERDEFLTALPDVRCPRCGGVGTEDGKECAKCKGEGTERPLETWYHFDTDTVKQFIEFLESCGGFEIW